MLPNIEELPRSIIDLVENSQPFISYKKGKELLLPEEHYFETPSSVIKYKTFSNDFNLSEQLSFPERLPHEKLVDANVFIKIGGIIEVLSADMKMAQMFYDCCDKFVEEIMESERCLDILAAFLIIFSKLASKFILKIPSLIVTCTSLYMSDCTVYNQDTELFPIINSLRSICLDLTLSDPTNNNIKITLYNLLQRPLSFAEYMHRLISVQPQISLSKAGLSLIIQSMMYSMAYYQTFDNISESQRVAVCKARKAIFIFMNTYLLQDELMKTIFNDSLFIECFLGLIFEEPVRLFVLAHLNRYLTMKESEENAEMLDKVMQISHYVADNMDCEQVISLGANLFGAIIPSFMLSQKLCGFFEPLISPLCQGIVKLEKSKDSSEFLLQVIALFNITVNHILTSPEIHAIQTAITNIYGDSPNQHIFVKIVQLIAGQPIANVHPSFIIRQPKVLKLLVTVFINSSIIEQVLDFIAQLLQFSAKNCELVSEDGFDIFLIDIIFSWRNDTMARKSLAARVFSLLMLICSHVCSVTTVRKYMSLLCPIEGRALPFYHQLSIKSISSMLLESKRKPTAFLPLDKENSFEIKGLSGEEFNESFSISFWLCCKSNNPHYKSQIALFVDQADSKIGIYLNGETLLLLFEQDGNQWSGKPEFKVPRKEWCFINITYQIERERNQFFIYSSLNANEGQYTYFPYFPFKQGPMSVVRIGGLACDSEDPEAPSMLGPFGLFKKLENDQRVSLYDAGPTGYISSSITPMFYIVSRAVDNGVRPVNVAKTERIINPSFIKTSHVSTFSDILINRCGIDIILPLFAQWDLPFTSGEKVPYICETTIEVLENALSLSEEAQKAFAEANGFQILSHLLLSTEETNITYNIYSRFFALLGVITSEKAYKSLFNDILTNIEIWIRCDGNDHLRIIKHWARVLAPTKHFLEKFKFSFILSLLRIYYWYDQDPTNGVLLCQRRCRGTEMNVSECRKNLLGIAHLIACQKFTKDDFTLLMSHIITVGALQQNIDLLEFLRELIDDPQQILITSHSETDQIALLQYLFNLKNERIVVSLISTVIKAHRKNLIHNLTIVNHLDIILHQLTPSFVTKSLLISLVGLAKDDCPELFPICSWMAVNIGDQATKFLLENLKPDKKYACTKNWSMWLVTGLFKAEGELRRKIIRFLIECSEESDLTNLFSIVDITGKALNEKVDTAKHDVLFEIGRMLLKKNDKINYGDYIKLIKHFLLYRDNDSGSLALQSMFYRSPFSHSKQTIKIQHGTPPRAVRSSPKKQLARKARYSLSPGSIVHFEEKTENYSPLLAEKALATLTNTSSLIPNENFKARRVSMVQFCSLPYEYETHHVDEKVVISMMPAELDKKIAIVAARAIMYTFGLRFSDGGQWLDYDLAEQFIDVFVSKPELSQSLFALTVASYLIHFDSPKVPKVLDAIQKNDVSLNPALYLMAHHAAISDVDIPFKTTEAACELASFQFTESLNSLFESNELKYSSLRLLKYILKSQTDNSQSAFDIFGMVDDFTVLVSSNEINDHSDIILQEKARAQKLWVIFWRAMTVDHAPWNKSLPKSMREEIHYKRDNTLCPSMVPVKLKRNYHFDNHLAASYLRDTGNVETAQEALEQKKKELKAEYEKNAPSQLFEIVDKFDEIEKERKKKKAESMRKQRQCIIEIPCELIKNTGIKEGTFALLSNAIVITFNNESIKTIDTNKITAALLRTRFHLPTAIELFLYTGKSYFINFPGIKSSSVFKYFEMIDLPVIKLFQTVEFKPFFESVSQTKQWMSREISNFDYIMHLNILSGRTFNDVSQYPIFPWVIKDYESMFLDLDDDEFTFRDLTKPIGTMNKNRLQELKQKFRSFAKIGITPYLFSSGYSCPLSVYLWLMRMEPFATLHIDIQSGKFDHAARLFLSIANSWKLSTTHQNDFRELIPEFFTQPEFLLNKNGYDLGVAFGKKVDDVVLPPWAASPYDFVYKNRKALESKYVSEHLNDWIDFVWGYQSRGENAAKIDNVFMPEMYGEIWTKERIQDPQLRAETEAVLCHVGQVPPQLFDKPHPKRSDEIPKISSLARPVIIPLHTKTIIASSISYTQSNKFKIIALDEMGTMRITFYDSITINKQSKHVAQKPRTRSGSDRVLISSPGSQWKSPRKYGLAKKDNVAIEVNSVDFNYTTKNFKQISSIKPVTSTKSKLLSVYSSDGSFFFVGSQQNDLIRVNPSKNMITLANRQRSSLTALAIDSSYLLTANTDSLVSLYNTHQTNTPLFTIPCFTSTISCADISSPFHQIVCGTKDGSLIIASLKDGSITRIVDLEGRRPVSVCITKSWGFLMLYLTDLSAGVLKHYISIYSINGDKIREAEIKTGIQTWSTYTNEKGFDFVVLVDESGDIFHFEAFYLDLGRRIISVTENFASISYIPDECVIIGVTRNGKAVFVPSIVE